MDNFFSSLSQKVREVTFAANEEVKKAVSGTRFRFEEPGQYSLDLTYISERIIAMGFPAMGKLSILQSPSAFITPLDFIELISYLGTEAVYRNNAAHVLQFFDKYHPGKWTIFNVSEVNYNYPYFPTERVRYLGWLDHHAPPMVFLLFFFL